MQLIIIQCINDIESNYSNCSFYIKIKRYVYNSDPLLRYNVNTTDNIPNNDARL